VPAGAGRVAAFEPLARRRTEAERCGADICLDPAVVTAPGDLREATGDGADAVFEMAGTAEAVGLAMAAARAGGRVVLGGIPASDQIAFRASTARRKGLTIAMVRRMNEVYPRAIRLAATGRVGLTTLVSHRLGLASAGTAFSIAAKREGLKVIIEPAARPRLT
jgi:L-iditol 2-dehydrogenase